MGLYSGLITQGVYVQFILFCVVRIVSLVTLTPIFNPRPHSIVATLGSTAELPCSVRNLMERETVRKSPVLVVGQCTTFGKPHGWPVIWKKKNQLHALTVGIFVFDKDPSLRVNHVPYNDEWNLVIEGVQRKHEGVYECRLSTADNMVQYVQLKVIDVPIRDPPDKGISLYGPKKVIKGHPIRLICNSSGVMDLLDDTITWFHNARIVKPDARKDIVINHYKTDRDTFHSELIIKHSKPEDSGEYTCRYGRKLTDHTLIVENESNKTIRGTKQNTSDGMKTEHVQSNTNGKPGIRISIISCAFILICYSFMFV